MSAVRTFSTQRLLVSRNKDDFPKEAAFQQLFNEAANRFLPAFNSLNPELSTTATKDGKVVTGELDFYVNYSLQWAVELLRKGDGIGEHLARFDRNTGKYREVEMKQHLVVDFRGPLTSSARDEPSHCTFCFSANFRSFRCKMRHNPLTPSFDLPP